VFFILLPATKRRRPLRPWRQAPGLRPSHGAVETRCPKWQARILVAPSGARITPGKNSDTRIKPLAFSNGHGCYINFTPERAFMSVGNGRYT
jgi:hypothetical protein